jgi:hypothetical protein
MKILNKLVIKKPFLRRVLERLQREEILRTAAKHQRQPVEVIDIVMRVRLLTFHLPDKSGRYPNGMGQLELRETECKALLTDLANHILIDAGCQTSEIGAKLIFLARVGNNL